VERQQKLVAQGFISKNAADDALAQRNALREQLAAAKARADATGRSLTKSRVLAPIDGEIESQVVASGDYVKVGDPLFTLVGMSRMRAHLLFPESAANRIRPGLPVRLESPAAPGKLIETRIEEIKPTVNAGNRALDAIVRFDAEGRAFRGGGSVNARVVIGVKRDALMVPEQSIVLRPAGKVVYVVKNERVTQRIVETGLRQDGLQEIVKGLSPGELIANDGAGFLSDGAAVTIAAAKEKALQ
jgi:membrane fusion protein (multidrug efflux system)